MKGDTKIMEVYKNPSGEFTPEEELYAAYVKDHIAKVQKSFNERGHMLGRVLQLSHDDMSELAKRVAEHDQSKWSVDEFPQYRNYFYPAQGEVKIDEQFAAAWKHHYETNDHHPEHWVINGVATDMSILAIAEMILDWEAMSRNFGGNPRVWFRDSKNKFNISVATEVIVSRALSILYTEDLNLKEYRNPILG